MKLQHLIGIGIVAMFGVAVIAQEAEPVTAPADAKAIVMEKKIEYKAQTLCPIEGNKIDKTQYADVGCCRIYACGKDCVAKIKADVNAAKKKISEAGECAECICAKCGGTLAKTADCAADTMQCTKCKTMQSVKADCAACPMKDKACEKDAPAEVPAAAPEEVPSN